MVLVLVSVIVRVEHFLALTAHKSVVFYEGYGCTGLDGLDVDDRFANQVLRRGPKVKFQSLLACKRLVQDGRPQLLQVKTLSKGLVGVLRLTGRAILAVVVHFIVSLGLYGWRLVLGPLKGIVVLLTGGL